jgi:Phosphate-selective porin O and P
MSQNPPNFLKGALRCGFAVATACALVPAPASAQITIKNEDVAVNFGIQGQFWADLTQDSAAIIQGYQQNLYLRRARLLMSGDIGKDISFFVETDSPNLGKTPKSPTTGFMLQDLFLEWKPTKFLNIDGGLFLVPLSRNALQSTVSYYTIDLSSLTTVNNSATQSAGLRDLGIQARGFFMKDRLQYRLGAFQGERDTNARDSLRTAAYVQYDFFDTETGYLFVGTALGKKKILAIDVGGDKQGSYRGLSANVATDTPVNGGDEIGGQFQYFHYDGRQKFTSIADQNDWFIEGAYYVHQAKTQPFVKFESQEFVRTANAANDIHRAGTGVNYYVHAQKLKWTLQYNRLLPQNGSPLKASNEFTMQFQVFYF